MLSNEVFDKVFTIVEQAMKDIEITDSKGRSVPKYKNLKCARGLHELETTSLPCLLMTQIGAPQIGDDLLRKSQNGVNSTFQVLVTSSVSYDEAYDIINDAGDIFIQLGYALTYGIQELNTDSPSIWRFVARFNRVVGGQDVLTL